MMIEPNILAFQNADVLAALEDAAAAALAGNGHTLSGLAAQLGRDKSNLRKTLGRMVEDELLIDPPLVAGLTDVGMGQLAAWRRARHGGERRKAQGRWRADKLRRNPDNRTPDKALVRDIADTASADGVGDILVPILASQPDAHGVRMVLEGEHRWEAVNLLIAEGRCPDILREQGLPFTERNASKGEAAVIALIANAARRDSLPWEDALQLKTAADELGLNATQLARRIGRAREGSRGGLRDVQAKLKVAREATAEAIAAYEADPTAPAAWERLRDSVTERPPEPVLIKAQRLALAELFAMAGQTVGREVRILPAAFGAEGARLAQYGLAVLTRPAGGLDTAAVTQAGADYLKAEGLDYGRDRLPYAREKLGLPGGWGRPEMRTEWLNVPGAPAVAAPTRDEAPDPEVAALQGVEPVTVAASDLRRVGEIENVETFTLNNGKPGWKGGPLVEIKVGRIPGQGWIVATKTAFPTGGSGSPFSDCPANPRRYVNRTEALITAIDLVRKDLSRHYVGQMLTAQVEQWLMRLDPERGPATSPDSTDPWLADGWRPIDLAFLSKAGTLVGPTLIAPRRAWIEGARNAPLLTLYSRSEERYAGTSEDERYENVTLYRARATVTMPDGSEIESSRIPGTTERMAAIQLATEDLLHEAHHGVATLRPAIEWLDAMSGQFVGGGRNCLNGSRAQERRFALGWDKRQSNSGSGGKVLDESSPDDATEAAQAMADLRASAAEPHPLATAGPQSHPTNAALQLLAVERARQVTAEGYDPAHDDTVNAHGELAHAAAAYAAASVGGAGDASYWPSDWDPAAFKPTGSAVRDLVKAGALILAEIERRQRAGDAA